MRNFPFTLLYTSVFRVKLFHSHSVQSYISAQYYIFQMNVEQLELLEILFGPNYVLNDPCNPKFL